MSVIGDCLLVVSLDKPVEVYAESARESDVATSHLSTSRHMQQSTDVISATTAYKMTSSTEQQFQTMTSDDVESTRITQESSMLHEASSYAPEAHADTQLPTLPLELTTNQDVTSLPLHTTTTTGAQIACRVNNNICYM